MYRWTLVSALDNPAAEKPRANPVTTTIYQVVGTDSEVGFSGTPKVPVVVYRFPNIDAGEDRTILVGGSVAIKPAPSSDVSAIRWQHVRFEQYELCRAGSYCQADHLLQDIC